MPDIRIFTGAGSLSKFTFSVSLALSAIFTGRVEFLCLLFFITIASFVLLGVEFNELTKVGKYALFMAIFVFNLHLFLHRGATVFGWWIFNATAEGFLAGLYYSLKLMVFALSGYIIIAAIDPYDLLAPLERLARHCGNTGRYVESLALSFFLALRFLPEFIERGRVTSLALQSRGIGHGGGLGNKARYASNLISPMFAAAIKKAGSASIALDIKGFGSRYYRATLPPIRLNFTSAVLLLISGGIFFMGWLTR
jgi:energy-coupling factor transporter transmembrane protein EcfT